MLAGKLDLQTLPGGLVHLSVCLSVCMSVCLSGVGCSVPTVSDECVQALTATMTPDGEGEYPLLQPPFRAVPHPHHTPSRW